MREKQRKDGVQRDHKSSETLRNVVKADDIKTEELPTTSVTIYILF